MRSLAYRIAELRSASSKSQNRSSLEASSRISDGRTQSASSKSQTKSGFEASSNVSDGITKSASSKSHNTEEQFGSVSWSV